jgi:predicted amidohydrolase
MQVTVACVQFETRPGKKGENLKKMTTLLQGAVEKGAKFIVFPELAVQGILPNYDEPGLAEHIPGPSTEALASLARQYDVYIVTGIAESSDRSKSLYNSSVLINPRGRIIGVYRKVHLWDFEKRWATKGSTYPVFDTEYGKVGMWICYDTRFPEVARSYALQGVRFVLVPTAWLDRHVEDWIFCARARSMDNGIFVCGADEICSSEYLSSCGVSVIADPYGNVLSKGEKYREGIVTATLVLDQVHDRRMNIPLLKDRQESTYSLLVKRIY